MIFKIRRFINPPYSTIEFFLILGLAIALTGLTVGVIEFKSLLVTRTNAASLCDESYPDDFSRVCYFSGEDPLSSNYLGSFDETPIGSPVPTRTFAINHDWGNNAVFNSVGDDISGVWRGRLNFEGGVYQLSTFADDKIRVYLDETLILDRWSGPAGNYAANTKISSGYHNIRVEWYEATGAAKLQLHIDKGPNVGSFTPQEAQIEVFILTDQKFCIAGESWTSGDRFDMYNSDGSVATSWQRDEALSLPKILKPSDPTLSSYSLTECFEMGFRPEELTYAKEQIGAFAKDIENLSGGALVPIVNIHEISGEQILTRWGGSLWLGWWDLQAAAEPYLTKGTDFTVAVTSIHDINTGKYHGIPLCGGTYGYDFGLGGAGYTWVPNTTNPGFWFQCLTEGVILNEWAHQFTGVVTSLLKTENIYSGGYPPCGQGDPNTFKWMPGLYSIPQDPSSAWCGSAHPGSIIGVGDLFLWHYDPTFSNYQLGYFTGNHCDNGIKDYGETDVDTGGNCPKDTTPPTVNLTSPTNDSTISGSVIITATASDDVEVTRVEFYVDDVKKSEDTSSPYSYSWDTTSAANGSHNIFTKAMDSAGNIGTSATVLVTISNPIPDTQPPSVVTNSPTGGATVSSTTTISATASDNVGVTKVEFYVDGSLKNTDTSSPYSYSWNTAAVNNGSHSVLAKAYDAAANNSTSSVISVNVKNSTSAVVQKKLGDLNSDGRINIRDLSILLSKWNVHGTIADVNSDGLVNIRDLSILLSMWGK